MQIVKQKKSSKRTISECDKAYTAGFNAGINSSLGLAVHRFIEYNTQKGRHFNLDFWKTWLDYSENYSSPPDTYEEMEAQPVYKMILSIMSRGETDENK